MRSQIVTRIAFGDKRAQFNVFPRHLLRPNRFRQDVLQFCSCRHMSQGLYRLDFLLMNMLLEALQQTIERYFCRIRDEREYRVRRIIIDSL